MLNRRDTLRIGAAGLSFAALGRAASGFSVALACLCYWVLDDTYLSSVALLTPFCRRSDKSVEVYVGQNGMWVARVLEPRESS